MNLILKTVIAFSSMLALLSHAETATKEPAGSSGSTPGVVVKVEKAVVRGAKAAASGVQRGAKAAAGGIETGVKATARGVEKGAKATAGAANRVAGKVSGSPASSPAAGK
jgi:hypothetical protein